MFSAIKVFFSGNRLVSAGLFLGLVIGAILWIRHDAYNDGFADRTEQVFRANAELRDELDAAESVADELVLEAGLEHSAKVIKELELIDEATSQGNSPFDAIFPSRMRD